MLKAQNHTYDLEERTTRFSEAIILLCQHWPKTDTSRPLLNQLIRSATSIGANYAEANGAASKKDFKNKITICKKESRETHYWLRLLSPTTTNKTHLKQCLLLKQEAKEFTLIFSKIILNTH